MASVDRDHIYCTSCGTDVELPAKFCPSCGKSLSAAVEHKSRSSGEMDAQVVRLVSSVAQDLGAKCEQIWEGKACLMTLQLPGGRSQVVLVSEVRSDEGPDKDFLRYWSTVGRFMNLDAVEILKLNLQLNVGAFAIWEFDIGDGLGNVPTLGIVDTQLVQTADFDEVKSSIKILADLADDFEKNLFGSDRL